MTLSLVVETELPAPVLSPPDASLLLRHMSTRGRVMLARVKSVATGAGPAAAALERLLPWRTHASDYYDGWPEHMRYDATMLPEL
jgi:hypothetical protein